MGFDCRRELLISGWVAILVMTLLATGCSKPEEVISSRVALANQKLAAGETDAAIEILEKLNDRLPDRPVVMETLGFAYAQAERHGMAAAYFVKAADADPASSGLRQLAAEAFFQEELIESAAEQHRLYLSEFPGDFQSWEKLGRIEERRGDLVAAVDAYLEWYRIRPNGNAAFALGSAFRRLNNAPQAGAWYEATISHGGANVKQALLGLLELEMEAGDLAAAEKTVGQLDRNFPGALDESPLAPVRGRIAAWNDAQRSLAQARAGQEQLARELEGLRRGQEEELGSDPVGGFRPLEEPPPAPAQIREPEPIVSIATRPGFRVQPTEGDDTEGASEASSGEPASRPAGSASRSAPAPAATAPPAADLVAAIELRERGDMEAAIDALWRALNADDSRAELWLELADAHRAAGDLAAAQAYALEARRRAPDSIEVETAYLNIVREAEPADVYLARIQAARKKFPANANLAYVFARELVEAEGDALRTVAAFEDFLLLADPADPRRREAAEFLARARRR